MGNSSGICGPLRLSLRDSDQSDEQSDGEIPESARRLKEDKVSRAVLQQEQQMDVQQKSLDHALAQVKFYQDEMVRCGTKNKAGSKRALLEKRKWQAKADHHQALLERFNEMRSKLLDVQASVGIVAAIRAGTDALGNADAVLKEADSVMFDNKDVMQDAVDVMAVLGKPIEVGNTVVTDADLEAELALAAEVPATSAVPLSAAPAADPFAWVPSSTASPFPTFPAAPAAPPRPTAAVPSSSRQAVPVAAGGPSQPLKSILKNKPAHNSGALLDPALVAPFPALDAVRPQDNDAARSAQQRNTYQAYVGSQSNDTSTRIYSGQTNSDDAATIDQQMEQLAHLTKI